MDRRWAGRSGQPPPAPGDREAARAEM